MIFEKSIASISGTKSAIYTGAFCGDFECNHRICLAAAHYFKFPIESLENRLKMAAH